MIERAPETPIHNIELSELFAWTCTHNNKYDWRMPTILEQQQSKKDKCSLATVYYDETEAGKLPITYTNTAKFIPVRDL